MTPFNATIHYLSKTVTNTQRKLRPFMSKNAPKLCRAEQLSTFTGVQSSNGVELIRTLERENKKINLFY